MAGVARADRPDPAGELTRLRLLFSSRMFTEVHEADAKAALAAWSDILIRERHIHAEAVPEVVDGLPALAGAIESGRGDLIMVTIDEYLALGLDRRADTLIVGEVAGEYREEYLLLVHQDGSIRDVADLAGRTLFQWENPRTPLASPWLDMVLMEGGLAPASEGSLRLTRVKKVSAAVLPVFFRQADACVVTRRSLETLSELNPQVGRQLRVLASSPPVVPSVACVLERGRAAASSINLDREVMLLDTTAPGKQLLTLFHCDRLRAIPASAAEEGRRLLDEHRRLLHAWKVGTRRPARPSAAEAGRTPPRSTSTARAGLGKP